MEDGTIINNEDKRILNKKKKKMLNRTYSILSILRVTRKDQRF